MIKKISVGIMVGTLLLSSQTMYARGLDSIRIGLESVYKDVSIVRLESDANFDFGYIKNNDFVKIGELPTKSLMLRETANSYYYNEYEVYTRFDRAEEVAKEEDGVVAYIAPNEYYVYYKEETGYTVPVNASDMYIELLNENSQVIGVANYEDDAIVFQGSSKSHDFPVTSVGSNNYRGVIEVVNGQTRGLTAVSVVDMQDYLYGVVPYEMSPSWNIEALKAQAVTARSIANFQANRYLSRGYNLVDTTYSQVYKGIERESANSNMAVDATNGEVVTYNGQIAEALYFSTSGGYTDSPEYVWGNQVGYLQPVEDIYELNPYAAPWTREITFAEIKQALASRGENIGDILRVNINARSEAGRVYELEIVGEDGIYTLNNEATRTFFSSTSGGSLQSQMYSFTPYLEHNFQRSLINIEDDNEEIFVLSASGKEEANPFELYAIGASSNKAQSLDEDLIFVEGELSRIILENDSDNSDSSSSSSENEFAPNNEKPQYESVNSDFTIYGKGWGHGVGMSQSGAKDMADLGYTYDEILHFYFTDIKIEK
ncbi:MAG: hypothetical protein ATN36_07960 [Epulopiscium sp. Nele67-Bin005]|nr:MAG: hypothetical protein ATN36_07960 [Epulopiscium sp. Nele67-Bin005]